MAEKKTILLHKEHWSFISDLDMLQRGKLLTMIFEYSMGAKAFECDDKTVNIIFKMIKINLDYDNERYKKVCNLNKKNAKKRWDDATACDRIHKDKDKEKDKDKTPWPRQSPSPKEILALFGKKCPSLVGAHLLTKKRRELAEKAASGRDLSFFEDLFARAEKSSFLRGKNKRGWCASFDWLMMEQSIQRLCEGAYDDADFATCDDTCCANDMTSDEMEKLFS